MVKLILQGHSVWQLTECQDTLRQHSDYLNSDEGGHKAQYKAEIHWHLPALTASGGSVRLNSHTMAIHRQDARWRPHKVTPGPTTGPIRQSAESHRHFDAVEWEFDAVEQEFRQGFKQFKWTQSIRHRGCWSWGWERNYLFRRFLTVSPASTGSNSENVDPGGVCWTAELWLARFLCNFIDYIPVISERLYTLFSYIYTTVSSVISPHFYCI